MPRMGGVQPSRDCSRKRWLLIFVDWCFLSKICFCWLPYAELEMQIFVHLLSLTRHFGKLADCMWAYQRQMLQVYQKSDLNLQRYTITRPDQIIEMSDRQCADPNPRIPPPADPESTPNRLFRNNRSQFLRFSTLDKICCPHLGHSLENSHLPQLVAAKHSISGNCLASEINAEKWTERSIQTISRSYTRKSHKATKSFEDAWIAFSEIMIQGNAQGSTKSGGSGFPVGSGILFDKFLEKMIHDCIS